MAILTSQQSIKSALESLQPSEGLGFLGAGFTDVFVKAGTLEIDYFLERQEGGKTKYLVPLPHQPDNVSISRVYSESVTYTFDTDFGYREISRPRQVRVVLSGQTGSQLRLGLDHRGVINYVKGKDHLHEFEQFLDEYHLDASNLASPVTYNLISLDNDIDYDARPYLVFRGLQENIHGRCYVEDFSYSRSVSSNRIDSYKWQLTLMVYDGVLANNPARFTYMDKVAAFTDTMNNVTGIGKALGAIAPRLADSFFGPLSDAAKSIEGIIAMADNIDDDIITAAGSVLRFVDNVMDVVDRLGNTWDGWSDDFEQAFLGEDGRGNKNSSGLIASFNRRFTNRATYQYFADTKQQPPRMIGEWYNNLFGENGTWTQGGWQREFVPPPYYKDIFPEYFDEEGEWIGPPDEDEESMVLEQRQEALRVSDETGVFHHLFVELLYNLEVMFGYMGVAGRDRVSERSNLVGFLAREAGFRALALRGILNSNTPDEDTPDGDFTVSHYMRAGESLMDIATRVYGSPDFWPTIAKVNGALDAYTLGNGQAITAGALIQIPTERPVGIPLSGSPDIPDMTDEMYFRDFEIRDGDLYFSPQSPNDLALIGDLDNIRQAIIIQLNTIAGEITRNPYSGIGTMGLVGGKITEGSALMISQRIREGLLEDPRILDVVDFSWQVSPDQTDTITLEMTVVTLGDRALRFRQEIQE